MGLLNALDVMTHLNYQIINYQLAVPGVTNYFIVKLLELAMVLKAIIAFLIALILFPGVLIVSLVSPKILSSLTEGLNVFVITA